MTTATANNHTNIVPLVRSEASKAASPEKGAEYVFSGVNGENGQSGRDRGVIGDFLGGVLIDVLADIEAQQKATNDTCRILIKGILCHPNTVKSLRAVILETNGDKARYIAGLEAMLGFFDAGENIQTTALCKQSSAKNAALTEEFQTKKIKPFIEIQKILVKKDDNSFRWATLEELQALAKTANDLLLETTDLPMTCNSPAIESGKPANGLRMIGKKLAVNPLAKVRHWQRDRAMQAAVSDPWKKVNADGAIEIIHNPFDLKANCPRTEKEKELIRKAAIVDAETRLKLKIAAAGDKQRIQEIQRASLEADSQAQAIINDSKLKLAQMQHERMMRRERLATYQPALIAAGIVAVVLLVYANNGHHDSHYPVELATMPVPAMDVMEQGE